MVRSRLCARITGLAAAVSLTGAIVVLSVPGSAGAAASCPTVNSSTGAVSPAPAPGADWSGCNLTSADLRDANLTGANLSDANFSGADVGDATLASANITGANLGVGNDAGLSSGGLVGMPAELPYSWTLNYGYLMGPLANLDDASLAGAHLSGVLLEEVTLKNANLTGADLSDADFDDATLTGATLTDADLEGTQLGAADLAGVALAGADLTGAYLYAVSSGGITGAPADLPASWQLTGGYLIGPDADLSAASLTGLDLSAADLAGADLAAADLTDANLSSANLTDGDGVQAVFAGADLAQTNLSGVDLNSVQSGGITGTPADLPTDWQLIGGYLMGPAANLSDADLAGLSLAGADLVLASLTRANLTSTSFGNADLTSANLSGADLAGAEMASATLAGVRSGSITGTPATLPAGWTVASGYLIGPGAYLVAADLAGADLAGADLTGATLTSADLASADLTDAILTEARMDFASLTGTNLTGASLSGVKSGHITGTPAVLPAGWALVDGYLTGPGADLASAVFDNPDLAGADLAGANLTGAFLAGANLSAANLTSANLKFAYLDSASLATANLTDAELTSANLTDASIDGATVTAATFTGVTWLNTICPDGTNSNKYVAGCFSALDTTPPQASPVVTAGTVGSDGWYVSPVTVTWNWTDAGTIVAAECPATTTTSRSGNPVTVSASCTDLAGNVGSATDLLKIDATAPRAVVAGVRQGATYLLGKVPAAGCRTTDSVSGVATSATLTVTTDGRHGVGAFEATCAGAVSVAGDQQAAPVTARYVVEYGLGGFSSPKAGVRLSRSGRIAVAFRLTTGTGSPIRAAQAAALGRDRHVRVILSGPGIRAAIAVCRWSRRRKMFTCSMRAPGALPGKSYELTAQENVGAGFARALPVGAARNPIKIKFR